jgi:large subunit ribosomal protein L4
MTAVDVLDPTGAVVGTVDLPDAVFDVPVNLPLTHQVVVAQLAAARQGTHSTKTRGEVSGGGRKPYRQKGTGRARQGSTRAPQFVGGGVVHGPKPRDYSQRTPKKMKAAALLGALSDRARHQRIHVVTGFVEGDVPATRAAAAFLVKITERKRVLVVLTRAQETHRLSVRNLPQVHLLTADQLNTYDVLVSDDVIFTSDALADFLASSKSGLEPDAAAAAAAAVPVPDTPAEDVPAAPDTDTPAKAAEDAPEAGAEVTASAKEDAATDAPAAEDNESEPKAGGEGTAPAKKEAAASPAAEDSEPEAEAGDEGTAPDEDDAAAAPKGEEDGK